MRYPLFGLGLALCLTASGFDSRYGYGDYGYGRITQPPAKPLTWEALAAAAPREKTIEGLLGWIAKEYPDFFENFTLMRESHSLQQASPSHPRAIVFQRGGKLILTFNGDATLKGFDRIEVMAYREPRGASSAIGARY